MTANAVPRTDYQLLGRRLQPLVEDSTVNDYAACVDRLLRAIPKYFPALTRQHNPVTGDMDLWSPDDLGFIIREYSGFSQAAIHMFLEARIRNHWPALTKEIIRNMDEEMGELTGGVPHLELMRYGYRVELGLETDGYQLSENTRAFINRMNILFCNRDNAHLAGVLLAFEGTAVDEFRIVAQMLRRYKEMLGERLTPESLTWTYIAGHVVPEDAQIDNDPEMDHQRGMIEAIGKSLTKESLRPMVQGFLNICLELNIWWEHLALEACQRRVRHDLLHSRRDPPELYFDLLENVCQTVSVP